jgi:DNA-binding MarR family transcriptional regulator
LIRRERSSHDKRRWHVFLSDAGRRLEAELLPLASHVEAQAVRGLSHAERSTLRNLLERVIGNMQEE